MAAQKGLSHAPFLQCYNLLGFEAIHFNTTETMGTQVASRAGPVYQDEQLLQYFLGLPVNQPPALPKECRELPNTSMKDVLFLSFDTENIVAGQLPLVKQFQVGISILDARALQNIIPSPPLFLYRKTIFFELKTIVLAPLDTAQKLREDFCLVNQRLFIQIR